MNLGAGLRGVEEGHNSVHKLLQGSSYPSFKIHTEYLGAEIIQSSRITGEGKL